MTQLRARLLALLTFVALLAIGAIVFAQTQVVVIQVTAASGAPGDATVTLTREGAPPHSCRTSGGTCRMSNVPPGMYVVTAQPTGEGAPPVPRTVPVVSGGEVTISVRLR